MPLPTVEAVIDAEETLRQARMPVRLLVPDDRILVHRPRPGETECSLTLIGTVRTAVNTTPDRLYPEAWWEVTIELDDGGEHRFGCSARHNVLCFADPIPAVA